jgi:hypothetical protein
MVGRTMALCAGLVVGCSDTHQAYPPEVGQVYETGVVCGVDQPQPPYVIGSCISDSFTRGCRAWGALRGTEVACRGGGYPCVAATRCDEVDGAGNVVCHCGDAPECGPGEICQPIPSPDAGWSYACDCVGY